MVPGQLTGALLGYIYMTFQPIQLAENITGETAYRLIFNIRKNRNNHTNASWERPTSAAGSTSGATAGASDRVQDRRLTSG